MGFIKDLLAIVVEKWNIIIESHIAFGLICAIACCIPLYFILTWLYKVRLEIQKERVASVESHIERMKNEHQAAVQGKEVSIQSRESIIAELRERLLGKEEQLNVYRLKSQEIYATGTTYTFMTNSELRNQALSLAGQIREFENEESINDSIINSREFDKFVKQSEDKSKEVQHNLWFEMTLKFEQRSLKTMQQYDSRFKTKSILIRDEILSRLPSDAKNNEVYRWYERPVNYFGMEDVAVDLERLARSLPELSQYEETEK